MKEVQNMKKYMRYISLLTLVLIAAILVCGCEIPGLEKTEHTVRFYVDGELYSEARVTTGSTVTFPKNPSKENQIFVGWYTDGLFSTEFNAARSIYTDLNLYAYFTLDAILLTNTITDRVMSSVVTVHNKSYNATMGGFIETEVNTSQGSGVVIDISGGWCYVLTNCHVAKREDGLAHQKITVEDAWGNQFDAQIYQNPSHSEAAISEEYDLALVCFKYVPVKDNQTLAEIEMAEGVSVGDYVVSLGTPEGQKNAITYGSVLSFQEITMEDEDGGTSKMGFDVICHTADIEHGSSGGPLLDTQCRLVGLNFAGLNDGTYGCAIPIEKIHEFLDTYVYLKQ